MAATLKMILEPFNDLMMCCSDPEIAGGNKGEAQRLLEQWRPAASAFGIAKKGKEDEDAEEEVREVDVDEEEDEDKSEKESVKSGSVRSAKTLSDDSDLEDDNARGQLADIRAEKQKQTARMEFEPILDLIDDVEVEDFDEPADLIQTSGLVKKQKKRTGMSKTGMGSGEAIELLRKMLQQMAEEKKDVELPRELADQLEIDEDRLLDAVAVAGDVVLELHEDEDGNQVFEKALAQKIWEEIQDNDGEPVRMDDLVMSLDTTEDEIETAVETSFGMLELEKKKKMTLVRARSGAKDLLDRAVRDDGEDEAVREAEARAVEFRRIQVQRKSEDFLRQYTRGQNLIKIVGGKRYHRRVYIDTGRKSLVVQGANGPKAYEFAHMREVDMESRTTKEGRLETLVTIAMEKNGRIYKELTLSFPDQQKGNTFVNCLSLFAMALRKAPGDNA